MNQQVSSDFWSLENYYMNTLKVLKSETVQMQITKTLGIFWSLQFVLKFSSCSLLSISAIESRYENAINVPKTFKQFWGNVLQRWAPHTFENKEHNLLKKKTRRKKFRNSKTNKNNYIYRRQMLYYQRNSGLKKKQISTNAQSFTSYWTHSRISKEKKYFIRLQTFTAIVLK